MKIIKGKKNDPDLLQKVEWDPESKDAFRLVLLCALIFGAAFFTGGWIMVASGQKEVGAMGGEKVLAAEDQRNEDNASVGENNLPKGKKVSEAMAGAVGSVKDQAGRIVRARKIARQKAIITAQIRSGPVLSGPTEKLSSGLRVCPIKNDHPQRGGATHIDEDCCPDYNETPNPRCYYTPGQRGIMK